MIVADLSRKALRRRLATGELALRTGGYVTRVRSSIDTVSDGLAKLYADYPVVDSDSFCDFQVAVGRPLGWRRWVKAQSQFYVDGQPPFKPLPLSQAFPLLEWGLNWCVSSHCHDHLVIHAAVLERDGKAAILPAPPGSGKSTLCATLVIDGWRLLSDELTLVRLEDSRITPLPRPVSLKNASIDIVRRRAPRAIFSPVVRDTVKGNVAHMRAPRESVRRAHETAAPGWMVFPRYAAGAESRLSVVPKAEAFLRCAGNAFNYSLLGMRGFETQSNLIEGSDCYELTYSRLDDALAIFAAL